MPHPQPVVVPHAPAIPGLAFRRFGGAADFPAMVAVANANSAADQVDMHRTVEDMARDYACMPGCDPEQDLLVAEVAGEMVGYTRGWFWTQADGQMFYGQLGFLAPQWRRRGIGRALLSWLEQRQRELAAGFPGAAGHHHHVYVLQTETGRAALLERAGYQPVRYFFSMVRPHLEAIADFALPDGIELRRVLPEHYRAIWDAHQDAFNSHWGNAPPRAGDYDIWLKSRAFQPQLWQIAWDSASNRVAGQVRTFIDHDSNASFGRLRGWTEFISVGAPWRRRGLARALISQSLRVQRAAGMKESALTVDGTNNDGANRVYEACGFEVVKRNTVYRKPVDL